MIKSTFDLENALLIDGYEFIIGIDEVGRGGTRNKRSVWTINTQPYSGAHFAVMPPDLARPCIMAGSKEGDLVLDPFAGSGTTLQVAKDLNRDYIGIEINESYRPLIEGRTKAAAVRAGERSICQWMLDGVV